MKQYLGVDPGQRRVGLALSDESGTIAVPKRVVDRSEESIENVMNEFISEYDVDEVIVGYPTPLKTDENERTRQVDRFIDDVICDLPVPFQTVSERYSTKEAKRLRSLRGESGPARDDEAAAMILEYFLERRSDRRPQGRAESEDEVD